MYSGSMSVVLVPAECPNAHRVVARQVLAMQLEYRLGPVLRP